MRLSKEYSALGVGPPALTRPRVPLLAKPGFCLMAMLAVGLAALTALPRASAQSPASVRPQSGAQLELLTVSWLFDTDRPPHSILTATAPHAEFAAPAQATNGFTIQFTANLDSCGDEKTILEIADVVHARLRQHDPRDRQRQNYPAFKMPDGSAPVLEATLELHCDEHPDWKKMTIGVPLAMLDSPTGEHQVVLQFSGVCWTMYVDGALVDNDFPVGYPRWKARNAWKLDAQHVSKATMHFPAVVPQAQRSAAPRTMPLQYWSPPGHNSWVGDVVTFFHQGRYHIFYLFDRRHHQSKFGCGAHYFEHISTADFTTWTEHEAATPLEAQWECIGTGTPFVLDKKLCLSYGLHTERLYPDDKTTRPAQLEHIKAKGCSGTFDRTAPGVPAGATYAVSQDGIGRFQKTGVFFHPCRNPSVYHDPRGKLRMLANHGAKGIWESESIVGGWRCVSPDFPPGGDCTFFFRWGKWDYIIGGFKDMWVKPAEAPDTAYENIVAQRRDCYDGLAVPAITEVGDGRFLMAGWVGVRGWGGFLVVRELIQHPDGRLSSRWMEEVTPATQTPKLLAASVAQEATFAAGDKPFILSFTVTPAETSRGKLLVSLLAEDGRTSVCDFEMNLSDRIAHCGRPIKNLLGVDQPFAVRLLVKSDDKLGGTICDVEIARRHTAISYREKQGVKQIRFSRLDGVELKNIEIAPLKQ